MKLFAAILLFVASATAGRLDNTYLPPRNAGTSGGSASMLGTPFNLLPSSFSTPISASHHTGSVIPSTLYGPTVTSSHFARTASAPLHFNPASVSSYSSSSTPPVPILRINSDNNGDGIYRFDYETANHIAAQESGHLKTADSSEVQGSYSYLAPNGQTNSVSYIADENGFRPAGDHLPTPPPIPAAILKSLEINAAEEARGIVDNGQYRPSAAEFEIARQYGSSSVNSQYLPPVTRNGYRY